MKKKILLSLTLLWGTFSLVAQEICANGIDDDADGLVDQADCDCINNRGNSWHFGAGSGIDFNTNPPTIFTSAMDTFEGCSSICDEEGNLLFYSNGGGRLPSTGENTGMIWNRNGEVMYDMMGTEGGGLSAPNSCIIVKKPNSTTNYYVFTMEEVEFNADGEIPGQPEGRGLSYFEVDMLANGGLGEVVLADQRLLVPTYEVMAVIQHDNGEDYWVIAVRNGALENREFVVFAATADGVEEAGSYFFPSFGNESFYYIKASPDGRRICEWSATSAVFTDFDPATGVFSNRTRILQTGLSGGEFSPSGQYFYFLQVPDFGAVERTILRVDMSTLSPASTFEEIESYSLPNALVIGLFQLGPNGAIYYRDAFDFLSAITCPDSPTPSIELEYIEIVEDGNASFSFTFFSLPTYPNHYFYRPFAPLALSGAAEYEICANTPITLSVQANKCADLLWNTGATADSIIVSTPGTYTVTAANACEMVTFEIVVSTNEFSEFDIQAPEEACLGESILVTPTDLPTGTSVEWQAADGSVLSNTTMLTVDFFQDTTIIGNFTLDCGIVQDTISIALVESPDPNLIFSDAGCGSPTGSASIIDPASSWTVQWLDAFGNAIGSGSTISELPAGSYQAEVSNVGNTTACSTLVPFSIEEVPTLVIEEVQVTSNPCSNDTNGVLEVISVIGEGDFTIEWLDANTGQLLSTDARLENLPNATYLLRITDEFDCVIEQQFVIDAPALPIVSVSTDPAFCDNPNGAIFIDNMDSAPLQIELDGQKVSEEELVDLFPNAYQLLIRSEADCIVLDSNLIIQNIIDTTLSGQLTLSGFSNRPIPIDLGLTDLVGLSISWSPTNGLSCIDCFNPIAELEESRIVQAILVDTITGCTGTYQVAITIRPEEQVYIPNAFSPNDDGINDFFQVFPSDEEVVILGVQVYSRWGELVYEQTGADVRWNGTANGSVLPSGVYVYVVEVQYSNRKELISGDVALLR